MTGSGRFVDVDGDLVYVSDDDDPMPTTEPPAHITSQIPVNLLAADLQITSAITRQDFTFAHCLESVLEIFPDVSHEYVKKRYNDFEKAGGYTYEKLPGLARLDTMIEELLAATIYPKQEKVVSQKKRKRESSCSSNESIDDTQWTRLDRDAAPRSHLAGTIRVMLKAEFPTIPNVYINDQFSAHKHVYQAFVALSEAIDNFDPKHPAFSKGRASTKTTGTAEFIAKASGYPELYEELKAARHHVQHIRVRRSAKDTKQQAEEENARHAKEAGETIECSVCFDDVAMNRQIHCDGEVAHFTCFGCATNYVSSEVGQSRCKVLCTAGCGAGFAPHQMKLLSDKPLLAKLAELEQQKAIRDAGLEDLEECPFCDYKAEVPPIEEDFEFRCMNPECQKISCRRCKLISHVPLSCAKYKQSLDADNELGAIHRIEEAMTEALMRSCNKCKTRFIKEYGCNKMTCPTCSNLQCYVCSESLHNYDHFDPGRVPGQSKASTASTKCPLYDNVEERHAREVKEAEAAARAKIVQEDPNVNADRLAVKMSDAVHKAEAERIEKSKGMPGGARGGYAEYAFPGGFGGVHDLILAAGRAGPGAAAGGAMNHAVADLHRQRRMLGRRLAGLAGDAGVAQGEDPEAVLRHNQRVLERMRRYQEREPRADGQAAPALAHRLAVTHDLAGIQAQPPGNALGPPRSTADARAPVGFATIPRNMPGRGPAVHRTEQVLPLVQRVPPVAHIHPPAQVPMLPAGANAALMPGAFPMHHPQAPAAHEHDRQRFLQQRQHAQIQRAELRRLQQEAFARRQGRHRTAGHETMFADLV